MIVHPDGNHLHPGDVHPPNSGASAGTARYR